jgi:hypothetical protein
MAKKIMKPASAGMRKQEVKKEPIRINLNGFELLEDYIYFNKFQVYSDNRISEYELCSRGRLSDIMRLIIRKFNNVEAVKIISIKKLSKIAYE